jgi:hypothetical protein
MTNTVQNVAVTSTENFSCTSLLTAVSSGAGSKTSTYSLSCLLALQPPNNTSTHTYAWNTGQSSTVTYTSSTVVVAANNTEVITSLGSVTSGLGQGDLVTRVVVLPSLSLTACSTTGVSATTGVATLEIV